MFGHFYRRSVDARSDMVVVDGNTKSRGRPKLTLQLAVLKDLDFLDIRRHDSLDRAQWRKQIHVADPN